MTSRHLLLCLLGLLAGCQLPMTGQATTAGVPTVVLGATFSVSVAGTLAGSTGVPSMVPGTMSWNGTSNNQAFAAGNIGLTQNGVSIYYAAKTSKDPALQALARDIEHIPYPVGASGRATQYTLMLQAFLFKYAKYPNAAKDYLRFMWEKDQYEPWQQASIGYVTQPLKAFEATARQESFTKAAAELCVTQGAVSQQVKGLESELGVRLFRRERQRLG